MSVIKLKKMTPELRKAWNKYLINNKQMLQHKDILTLIKTIAMFNHQKRGIIDIELAETQAREFMIKHRDQL